MTATPNTALQRTRVRPAGGRSPLSLGPFGVTVAKELFRKCEGALMPLVIMALACSTSKPPQNVAGAVESPGDKAVSSPFATVELGPFSRRPLYPGFEFRNDTCGVAFRQPAGWTVYAEPNARPPLGCHFEIVKDLADGEYEAGAREPTIYLEVFWQSAESIALGFGFEREGNRWHFLKGSIFDGVFRIESDHGLTGICASETVSNGPARTINLCVLGDNRTAARLEYGDEGLEIGGNLALSLSFLDRPSRKP